MFSLSVVWQIALFCRNSFFPTYCLYVLFCGISDIIYSSHKPHLLPPKLSRPHFVPGGAGGLLLDTGCGPSFLPLPTPVLDQVAAGNKEPGVTTLKLPETFQRPSDPSVRDLDLEVCFVCKKCRLAFTGESPLLIHQRQCYAGDQASRGAFRIVQAGYECRSCSSERFKSFLELKKHCDSEAHFKATGGTGNKLTFLPPPSESPLSHEMEDVVNQITLLAAQAQVDSGSGFCQPEPKRRFLTPADVAQPLATGH
ncbi:unnamed protein product [Phaedon cochleariae]|uniref:C2H2-type domain-containing protein n=1 Tax=Phaedon cochleariae TaxID=80249 RepID=A0A9P0DQM7_PHACE|nr:unnamed protein product [Phaedon cochleariae]